MITLYMVFQLASGTLISTEVLEAECRAVMTVVAEHMAVPGSVLKWDVTGETIAAVSCVSAPPVSPPLDVCEEETANG